ncbi:MAG: hypothetical protein H6822_15370 [Planctomycetaceae bacterium]|nr:hypothetical protein [Planctomycetales bacterium]MCB9923562.1 hypothetical protein [Planctomycetaceae bacterium]
MSTRDFRGRDTPPQPPHAGNPSGQSPKELAQGQVAPLPPIVPQPAQVTSGSQVPPTPPHSVIPPHLRAVPAPTTPLPPVAPAVPQAPAPVAAPATPIPQPSVPGAQLSAQPAPRAIAPRTARHTAVDHTIVEQQSVASSPLPSPDDEGPGLRETIQTWRAATIQFVTQFAVPNAPPWMVSMLLHLGIILILALIALPQIVDSPYVVEVTYAEELGEQLIDDSQFIESLEPIETDPALAFDTRDVENPLAAAAMPQFKLELFDAAAEMQTPAIGMALSGREPGAKRAMLAAYGGSKETEGAVEMALEWLKRNQKSDGTWSLAGPYSDGVAGTENALAATAMALLAFQGAGNTHQSGEYKSVVKKGMEALLKMQDRDGSFFATQRIQSSHQLYSQAQATIAVCELYGMTQDSALRDPAQRALDYAGSIQADDGQGGGGWRYQPGKDVDTSVTGWFVIALKSGEMGRLSVPSPVKDRISRYLDNSAAIPGEGEQFVQGSRYLYRIGERDQRVSMTAEALLCRQYLGWEHNDPRLASGVQYVSEHPISWDEPHVYYWYYATQLMHHMGGDAWEDWNDVMRKVLPTAQAKTGRDKGSWSPAGDQFGYTGGRLFMTCLCTYMLEVYYRHMPIYQH